MWYWRVKCGEIEDTPESAVISPSNGINYWFIVVLTLAFVILTVACLLLSVFRVVKYYMRHFILKQR